MKTKKDDLQKSMNERKIEHALRRTMKKFVTLPSRI